MQHILKSDLEAVVRRINNYMGLPLEPYSKDSKGKYQPNANVYLLDWAYGGVQLSQMCEEGTGQKTIIPGYGTKRELYDKMQAFLNGIGSERNHQKGMYNL